MQDPRAEMCERETGWWSKSEAKLCATVAVNHPHRRGGPQVGRDGLSFHPFKSDQMMNGEPASEAPQPLRAAAASVRYVVRREQRVSNTALQMLHVNVIVVSTLQCLEARQDLALALNYCCHCAYSWCVDRVLLSTEVKNTETGSNSFSTCVTEHNWWLVRLSSTHVWVTQAWMKLNTSLAWFSDDSVLGGDYCFISKSFCPQVFPTLNADFQPLVQPWDKVIIHRNICFL